MAMASQELLSDDELDDALEAHLASCSPPLPTPPQHSFTPSASPSSLTFAFPGWGVEIYRDRKHRKPSIIRHQLDTSAQQEQHFSTNSHQEARHVSWGDADKPGDTNSVYKMPNEIVLNVMKRLGIKDLCSAMQTCHWWQHLGSRDEVWEQFDAASNGKQPSVSLPRWGIVKINALSAQVQNRVASKYAYFWKGFDHLRSALHAWWDTGRPDDQYNSKSIGGLMHKLTVHDWTLLYEFFGVVFIERADSLAVTLMRDIEEEAEKNSQALCPFGCNHDTCSHEIESKTSNRDFVNTLNKTGLDLKVWTDEASQEGFVGRRIWKAVDVLWKRYKHWLMLVFEHCPELNRAVMAEKSRTTARSTTPTVYEKGVISFRSQILVKYGLRRVLQSGFSFLSAHDANGLASELEVELLRSIYHLLQELDVRDDTLSPKSFTQAKLWHCFPIKRSHAKHILDEIQNRSL